jgi:hypothetical protein
MQLSVGGLESVSYGLYQYPQKKLKKKIRRNDSFTTYGIEGKILRILNTGPQGDQLPNNDLMVEAKEKKWDGVSSQSLGG